jgi:hypothetical protein
MWYDGGDKKVVKRKIKGQTWLETSIATFPQQWCQKACWVF